VAFAAALNLSRKVYLRTCRSDPLSLVFLISRGLIGDQSLCLSLRRRRATDGGAEMMTRGGLVLTVMTTLHN
jgi:hypothetical protein